MNKSDSKFFNLLRNGIHFYKILIIFTIFMHILYWIQTLTHSTWNWTLFMNPIIESILNLSGSISSFTIKKFGAIFELKYIIAIFIYIIMYFSMNLCLYIVQLIEDLCNFTVKTGRKFEEKLLNKSLKKIEVEEQSKIKKYQIYLETAIKAKALKQGIKADIEEQNKLLLKHLVNKTQIIPQKLDNGLLFTFNSFDNIDAILDIFTKLPQSQAPIDYITCVQILDTKENNHIENLRKLSSLRYYNKIIALADTVYRYNFNENQNYEISQLGIYQKNKEIIEIYQFIKKDL